jgi:DNA-binding transcriptional LysR family regulator
MPTRRGPAAPRFAEFQMRGRPPASLRGPRAQRVGRSNPCRSVGLDCFGLRPRNDGPGSRSQFESGGETVRVDPAGPLIVGIPGAVDLGVEAAIAGSGIVYHFEDWLRPHLASGALEPVLEPWWLRFSGPFLYYPGRRLVPAPLRAFVDFIKQATEAGRQRTKAVASGRSPEPRGGAGGRRPSRR